MQHSDMYFNTDWKFEMFKRGKDNGHDTWYNVNFKIVFLIFSNISCRHTLELPLCVPTTYVFSINELFTIRFFQTDSQLFFIVSVKRTCFHVVCNAP